MVTMRGSFRASATTRMVSMSPPCAPMRGAPAVVWPVYGIRASSAVNGT